MSEQSFAWHVGVCPQCERPNRTVGPLHGAQGGPPFCIQCGVAWHGKNGRKRKSGRIVIKAMQMFFKVGGKWTDINKLALRAQAADAGLGYLFGQADTIGCDVGDITTELLRDTLRLTHPDVHPPERRELAGHVTAELRALEPYVFPAPKPDEPSHVEESPPARVARNALPPLEQMYPCERCEDAAPFDYCNTCRSEWRRRQETERERERQKQRARYHRRKERERLNRRLRGLLPRRKERERLNRRLRGLLPRCAACDDPFEPKRLDAKYCSPACRQRAHRRRRVTAKTTFADEQLNRCNAKLPQTRLDTCPIDVQSGTSDSCPLVPGPIQPPVNSCQ